MKLTQQALLTGTWVTIPACHDPPLPPYTQPLQFINAHFPPTFVIATKSDLIIPYANSQGILDAMQKHGVEVEMRVAEGMLHGSSDRLPFAPAWPDDVKWWGEVFKPSLDFVIKHLRME